MKSFKSISSSSIGILPMSEKPHTEITGWNSPQKNAESTKNEEHITCTHGTPCPCAPPDSIPPLSVQCSTFNVQRLAKPPAFTLIELLVATTVLMLVMITLVSVVRSVSDIWLAGKALNDTQMTARAALDLIGRDLQSAIKSPQLPAFTDNRLVFYTLRPSSAGSSATNRRLTCVEYVTNGSGLERREVDLSTWAGDPLQIPLGATNVPGFTFSTNLISANVVAFTYQFLGTNGTFQAASPGTNTVAIRVGLAMVDQAARDQLKLAAAESALATALQFTNATNAPVAAWKANMDSAGWTNLPPKVRGGLRFFERTYPVGAF